MIEVTITPHIYAPFGEFRGKIYVSKAFDSEEDFADACELSSGNPMMISDTDPDANPCLEVVSSLYCHSIFLRVQRKNMLNHQNKIYLKIYNLSLVRPDFRCADIVRHVRHVTGLTVKCEPVPTRYDTYASYCIRDLPNEMDILMNSNLWPRGVN